MKKPLLTVSECARILGFSVQHTRLLIRAGELPARKLGRDWLIVGDQLGEYLHQRHEIGHVTSRQPVLALNVTQPAKVVNVSSVPQRSPFRYPGGKTWLVPYIRRWLHGTKSRKLELIEPFAGGGIVSLTAVFENLVERATLVELDENIASVWETVLNGQGAELANRIRAFAFTPDSVREVLQKPASSNLDRAFVTILRNRVSRGGIMAPGAGVVKKGENGKGLSSRWYPETLSKRITEITNQRERLMFIRADGIGIMRYNADRTDAVFLLIRPTQ